MPELTTQSMESSKSLAKQDQEHFAYIRFTSFCISYRSPSTVSYVRRILSRIMFAIQAQHFEPLLYSTVYGPKLENCLETVCYLRNCGKLTKIFNTWLQRSGIS